MSNFLPDLTYVLEAAESVGRTRSPKLRVHATRTRVENLRTVGTIATFLAAVQAQLLAFSILLVDPAPVLNAASGCSVIGIVLDVLGALFSLFAAQQLSQTRDTIDEFREYVLHLEDSALNEVVRAAKDTWHCSKSSPVEVYLAHETLWMIRERLQQEHLKKAKAATKTMDDIVSDNASSISDGEGEAGAVSPPTAMTPSQSRSALPRPSRPPPGTASPSLGDVHRIVPYDDASSAFQALRKTCRAFEVFSIFAEISTLFFTLGFLCFAASIVCLAAGSLPSSVFISALAVLGSALVLPFFGLTFSKVLMSRTNRRYAPPGSFSD